MMQPANAPVSFKRQNSTESSAHSAQAGLLSTWISNGGWTKHPALLISDKLALSYNSRMKFGAYLRQLLIIKVKLKAVVFLWLQASWIICKQRGSMGSPAASDLHRHQRGLHRWSPPLDLSQKPGTVQNPKAICLLHSMLTIDAACNRNAACSTRAISWLGNWRTDSVAIQARISQRHIALP